MAGLFEGLDLSRRMQNPLVQMGMQMMANSGPSLQPKGLFEGAPEAISRGLQMQQQQQTLDQEESAKNRTLELLRVEDPEIAAMVEAGNLDAKAGISLLMDKRAQAAAWGREDARFAQNRAFQLEDRSYQAPDWQTFQDGGNMYRYDANDPEAQPELWHEGTGESGQGDETFFGTPMPFDRGDGTIAFGQLGNRGSFREVQMPEGATAAPTTRQVDTGSEIITMDVYGNELYRTPKTGPLAEGRTLDQSTGQQTVIPGSEAAEALGAKQNKALGALGTLERQWVVVGSDIDRAIDQAQNFSTTGVMSLSGAVLGTPAYDLSQTLNTIKANIGFDYLQQMRENSPTGGALGAITENELALLQAVNGATAQGQTAAQLTRNLTRIKELQSLVLQERRDAFQRDYGGATQPNANPQSLGDLRSKYGLENG